MNEKLIYNKAEVLADGTIQLREEIVLVLQDGSEYPTGKYHRRCFTPDMDIATIDCSRCANIAKDEWTQSVIDAYKASIASQGI